MKVDKKLVLVAVAAFALAFFMARSNDGIPNPFAPQRPDRPILRFIVKAAKTFLWVAMFAEQKPEQHARRVVQAIGPDGTEYLEHGDL